MLTIKIRLIIGACILLALIYLVSVIVKKKLDVKYALPWMGMFLALAVLDIFPSIIVVVANIVGISNPTNMLFFFGFIFALMIIFYLTMAIYSISNRLRRVSQELALLKNKNDKPGDVLAEGKRED